MQSPLGAPRLTVSPIKMRRVRNSNTAFCVAIDQKALCSDCVVGTAAPFLARWSEGVERNSSRALLWFVSCCVARNERKNKSKAPALYPLSHPAATALPKGEPLGSFVLARCIFYTSINERKNGLTLTLNTNITLILTYIFKK